MVSAEAALPVGGRKGKTPACPYSLGKDGAKWWRWAWATPQAVRWNKGYLYHVARRAQLEDDLAVLGLLDELELTDLLAGADPEAIDRVKWALSLLKQSAAGKLAVEKEMRELDTRVGLNAVGMNALGWFVGTVVEKKDGLDELTAKRRARRSATA